MFASKLVKLLLAVMVVSFCFTDLASAADRTKKQDRKKDGSCQSFVPAEKSAFSLASTQQRDRKKDGSCRYTTDEKAGPEITANKTRTRDRKKDGSCQTYVPEAKSNIEVAAAQTKGRDRKRDRSCQS
jgi:hypothetical protein